MKKLDVLLILFFIFSIAGYAQETEVIYLSGKGYDDTVEWDFMCTGGRKANQWSKIPVTSCWELQGFGTYNYGHDDPKADEKGIYKRKIDVKPGWEGKKIYLVFEGSMTDTEVKINGRSAGAVHKGAFYRFRYDISSLLRYSGEENNLEVTVSKMSSNKSINDAERQSDFWVFGGIFRPVYIEINPQQTIDWTAIDAKASGDFLINIYTDGVSSANEVEAQIMTLEGNLVGQKISSNFSGKEMVTLTTKVNNPKLWSPEFPNLYKVKVTLKENGNMVHEKTETFGFRTVELRFHDGIYVNGQKIMLKGVNRHSFYPSTGRTTNKALSIQDVTLMKEMNMNAVRMSHYPPDAHFLDACDSLGLFVLDELAGWQDYYDTETGKRLIKQMLMRDVNHPGIIFWDNGNEGGWNYENDDEFAKYDPQKRNVIHPWEVFRGTDTQHYKEYGYGVNTYFNGRDVFFPTEFLHGLYDGGHGAGLDDYWNLMLTNPLAAGGFLWCLIDEGVVRTDKDGIIDTDGNHAPDGILGPYREKEGSFYTIKEIWSPVYIHQKYISPQFDGRVPVENRFFFTNLNQCNFAWELASFPLPSESTTDAKVNFKGKAVTGNIPAGQKGFLTLNNLPANWNESDVLYLTATDPHGKEIYTWSWELSYQEEIIKRIVKTDYSTPVKVTENPIFITVSANGTDFTFDKTTGLLNSVKQKSGLIEFNNGPVLAHQESDFKEIKHGKEGKDYVIELIHEKAYEKAKWTIMGNGWLKFEFAYRPRGKFDFIGVNFNYPEEKVKGVKYLGEGPYRVWKNRMKGTSLGVWEKEYNNTITGESWDYPEFKGYHANFYWAVLETEEQPITMVTSTSDIFLRLYTPGTPKDPRTTDVKFPEGDISFMHAINPIGTKFRPADNFGPQSQKNSYTGGERRAPPLNAEIYFYFGK